MKNKPKLQRCNKKQIVPVTTNCGDYNKYYHNNNLNMVPLNIIYSINRLHYTRDLPYNLTTKFISSNFLDKSLLCAVPSIILKDVFSFLDLKSIYCLSRTCWKMLLFSRTNVIVSTTLKLHRDRYVDNNNTYIKYKNAIKYQKYCSQFSHNATTYIKYNKMDQVFKLIRNHNYFLNSITYKDPYGFQIYINNIGILEILLFDYKYLTFMIAFEYAIKRSFRQIIDGSRSIHNVLSNLAATRFINGINCETDSRCYNCNCACYMCNLFYCKSNCECGCHFRCHCIYPDDRYYSSLRDVDIINENIEYYFDDTFKYDYCLDS